jgi:DNA-binding MarR family transcriptional regulator
MAAEPSAAVVAAAVASFVQAFDGWSRRRALEAGASEPRLRLLNELHCVGPRKMADLAGVLGVTPRNVTALVDGLEAEGLVARTSHPTDRRVTLVALTGGAERVEAQFATYQASLAGLFAELGKKDRRALARVLPELEARMRARVPHDSEHVQRPTN